MIVSNGRKPLISTFKNHGKGDFTPGPTTELMKGQDYYSVGFAKMDTDQFPDAVVVMNGAGPESGPYFIMILKGKGDGTFAEQIMHPIHVEHDARVASLADVNADGSSDVVLTFNRKKFTVYMNLGNGLIQETPYSPVDLPDEPFGVKVADMNQDKLPDLLITTVSQDRPFSSKVVMLFGNGSSFNQAPGSPFLTTFGAYGIDVADIDGENGPDVITSSFETEKITVLLNSIK